MVAVEAGGVAMGAKAMAGDANNNEAVKAWTVLLGSGAVHRVTAARLREQVQASEEGQVAGRPDAMRDDAGKNEPSGAEPEIVAETQLLGGLK